MFAIRYLMHQLFVIFCSTHFFTRYTAHYVRNYKDAECKCEDSRGCGSLKSKTLEVAVARILLMVAKVVV